MTRVPFAQGLLSLLAVPSLLAQAPPRPSLPSADEVIKKVIERAKLDSAKHHEPKYVYSMRNVIEVLDNQGSVKDRRERLYRAVLIDGEHFYQLVEKDGKPLTEEDRTREREREAKFRQTAAERKRKKEQEKHDEDVQFNEELFGKFKIEIVNREPVSGRSALVATFEPKRKDLPTKRRIDFLLNKVAGQVWIDDEEYEIVKALFHLTEPVSKFMGILASVRKFEGSFEQTRVEEDLWFPNRFENYFEGRIVFKSLHQRTRQEWNDFKKASD